MKEEPTFSHVQNLKSNNLKSRREFIKKSTIAALSFHIIPRSVLGKGFIPPSDKINLGVIGLGKQGNLLSSFFLKNTSVRLVAGSDVWASKRGWFKQEVNNAYAVHRNVVSYDGVDTYLEYKELLARPDIDAVIIATPDHWHAIQSIDAMEAGKDVFCEKPLTNTIQEGIDMVNAVQRTGSVFQTGSMQRSWEIFRKAKDIVSSGKLGDIMQVQVNVGDPGRKFDLPSQPIPRGVDWNRWCGPAPLTSYHDSIAPEKVKTYPDWRFFNEFGGGILSDWGAHMFDVAQWALDMDHTGPIIYRPPSDPKATRGLRMYYENGIEMIHHDFGRGWAVRFIGSHGILDVSRGFLETMPSAILHPESENTSPCGYDDHGNFYQDWISGIKTRVQPFSDVVVGHRTATICNAANIAYQLKREIEWDPIKEEFLNDKEANKLMKRDNRNYSN